MLFFPRPKSPTYLLYAVLIREQYSSLSYRPPQMRQLLAAYQFVFRCSHSDKVVLYPGCLSSPIDHKSLVVSVRLFVYISGLPVASQPVSWCDGIALLERDPDCP